MRWIRRWRSELAARRAWRRAELEQRAEHDAAIRRILAQARR